MADRQGFTLVKSKRKDPRAVGYGCFMVIDQRTKKSVAGKLDTPSALTIDEVEEFLTPGDVRTDTRSSNREAGL